jgi:hypothetical protein
LKSNWTTSVPPTRATGDVPAGGPAADMNLVRAALLEIRANVPSVIADITSLQSTLDGLSNRVSTLEAAGSTLTVPGAPTIGTATAGSAQASVSFTPPASTGGATITSYVATASPGGATASGASSPITVSGLTNGTTYTFTVKAVNSVGQSSSSAASNAVTPAAAGTTTFTATAGSGQVVLNWSTSRTDIASWGVARNGTDTDGSGLYSTTVAAGTTTFTMTKLVSGFTYTFTLTPNTATGALTPLTATATPTGAAPATSGTLVGWSSSNIPGVTQRVYGQWTARNNWTQMNNLDYIDATPLGSFVAAHPNDAIDQGIPLIPFDSGRPYNTELDEAIAGTHDSTFTAMGQKLANVGPKTVYARLWWEFNMFSGGFTASKFVSAWQRAVPLIRSGFTGIAGSNKTLKIVWCYLTRNIDPNPMWPGASFVDVIGSDVYGIVYGTTNPSVSAMINNVNGALTELSSFAAAYNKPVCLGEWANVIPKSGSGADSRGCGDCPEYIDAVFDWINSQNATARPVTHVTYFNDAGGGVGQLINNTPNSLARFQARVAALG